MNIQHNIQLLPYNSFRTHAVARNFCEPASVEEIGEVLHAFPDSEILILGGGFNLFFTKDFDGLIIKPAMKGIQTLSEDEKTITLEVQAGGVWDDFVAYCVERGYAGIENLSLIPSSVGACPFQNIGAYGSEVKDTILSVNAVNIRTHQLETFTNEACRFGYRDSMFKQTRNYIITSVTFRLSKTFVYNDRYADVRMELQNNPSPSLAQVREAIIRIRTRKLPDPEVLPNAGSFFKNPVLSATEKEELIKKMVDAPIYTFGENQFKTSAAYLIEKAGWKGERQGNVGVSERHALVVVSYGAQSGSEIVHFMHLVQQSVEEKFGIRLEPEVQIV